jgi:hypothetical protein
MHYNKTNIANAALRIVVQSYYRGIPCFQNVIRFYGLCNFIWPVRRCAPPYDEFQENYKRPTLNVCRSHISNSTRRQNLFLVKIVYVKYFFFIVTVLIICCATESGFKKLHDVHNF